MGELNSTAELSLPDSGNTPLLDRVRRAELIRQAEMIVAGAIPFDPTFEHLQALLCERREMTEKLEHLEKWLAEFEEAIRDGSVNT